MDTSSMNRSASWRRCTDTDHLLLLPILSLITPIPPLASHIALR